MLLRYLRRLRRPLTTTPYNLPGMSGILGFLESQDSWDCTSRPDLTRNVTSQLRPHAEVYGPPCARARSASPTRPALRQPPAWTRWTSYRNRPATTTPWPGRRTRPSPRA